MNPEQSWHPGGPQSALPHPGQPFTPPLSPHPTGEPWPDPAASPQHPTPAGWSPYPAPDGWHGNGWTCTSMPGHPTGAGQTHRRTRQLRTPLLLGGAALLVLLTAAIVLLTGGAPSGPATPEEAAQTFVEAAASEDWPATWDMSCALDQLLWESRTEYIRHDGLLTGVFTDSEFTVGDVRYVEDASAHIVDVQARGWNGRTDVEIFVIEEDGGFRVCGMR